jgi:multidrug efflux pump subunit AcrA (membrane-fusion protein)
MSDPGLANPDPEHGPGPLHDRAHAASTRAVELKQQAQQVLAETLAIQQALTDAQRRRNSSPAGRELLLRSAYARLQARLDTMPVIEQAKGIIMAQSHCGDAEAFDMLRRASQRSNVPVRDLAAQIVANTAGVPTPPPPGPNMNGPASKIWLPS